MITKPFELNKERLRKDFMSPKYENRIKEFFVTFSEFLQAHIRKKYYDFMNDIQTEVNFFESFDKYYKPKILTNRNTNSLQKQATNRTIITKDRILTPNHAHDIPNTRHIVSNTPSLTTLTTNHAIADNIYFAKKQTPLASQYGQINIIKKDNTYKDKKKPKLDKIPIVNPPTKKL